MTFMKLFLVCLQFQHVYTITNALITNVECNAYRMRLDLSLEADWFNVTQGFFSVYSTSSSCGQIGTFGFSPPGGVTLHFATCAVMLQNHSDHTYSTQQHFLVEADFGAVGNYSIAAYCRFQENDTLFWNTTETFNGSTESSSSSNPEPTTSHADYCNGHGSLQCSCHHGFTGQYCDTEINWCNEPVDGVAANITIGQLCSLHGTCSSSPPTGATCQCHPGFQGQLCQTVIDGQETYSQRCALYNTSQVIANDVNVGCPEGQRCLADNLDCAYGSPCTNPVGWCLPKPNVDKILSEYSYKNKLSSLVISIGSRKHVKDSEDVCNGQGDPTCQCDYAYTGTQCDSEINFCNEPLAGVWGSPSLSSACTHGSCQSSVAGAHCICNPGLTGTFCQSTIPEEAFCGLRCLLYSSPPSNVTVGCSAGQRCLSDNLDCAFGKRNCPNPVGWCAPDPAGGGGLSPP